MHVGHSTGGGEVVHYLARHGESRAATAVLITAVPPIMVKTQANPGGLPKEVVRWLAQAQVANNRAQFYRDCRRVRSTVSIGRGEGIRGHHSELVASGNDREARRRTTMGSRRSQRRISPTDLKKITVPDPSHAWG